jgi:hypothetical protein
LGTGTAGWFGFTCRLKAIEEGNPPCFWCFSAFVQLSVRICAARANFLASFNLCNPFNLFNLFNSFNSFGCGFAALSLRVFVVQLPFPG